MPYQIDQSGKIEQTNKNTVLAGVNLHSKTLLITGKEKRRLQEMFRRIGKPQLFINATFSILLYSLIKDLGSKEVFEVDIEYPGHTKIIKKMTEDLLGDRVNLGWVLIGKNSKAHDLAYKTFRGKFPTNRKVSANEVWKLTIKIAGGRLNTGLSPANRRSAPAITNDITQKKKKSRTNLT